MAEEHVKDAQCDWRPQRCRMQKHDRRAHAAGHQGDQRRDAIDVFAGARKPIVVAQLQPADLPDALRRKPRFDFSGEDYKAAFRELAQVLTE